MRNIIPQSKQGHTLMLMLRHVCCCSDFIQSYAQDKFCTPLSSSVSYTVVNMWFSGKRLLKNISDQVDKRIEDLCAIFVELRKAFVDHAIVTTEITVLQILDDVGVISTQLDGTTTQLRSRDHIRIIDLTTSSQTLMKTSENSLIKVPGAPTCRELILLERARTS